MPEFQRLSFLVSENLVVFKAEVGRGVRRSLAMAQQVRDRITLGFGGALQGADWAV